MHGRIELTAAILVMTAGLGTRALGQNALGDGRALDRNLSTQGPQNTQVRDLESQIRFNQRIIEGQAGRGRSFQGDLGYRAVDDFAGSLGSESLYSFRRDSFSGRQVGIQGLRSTDALRYQFGLITGGAGTGVNLAAPAAGMYFSTQGQISTGSQVAAGGSELSPRMTSVRSVSQYQAVSSLLPTVLAYAGTEKSGQIAHTASPLRGIAPVVISPPPGAPAGSYFGSGLSGMEPRAFGVSAADNEALLRQGGRLVEPVDQRIVADPTPYRIVVESLTKVIDARFGADGAPAAAPAAGETPGAKPAERSVPSWLEGLDALRARLRDQKPVAEPAAEPGAGSPARPPEEAPGPTKPGEESVLDALKRMEAQIKTFKATPQDAGMAYAESIAQGEAQLAAGEYFRAEGSFSMALVVKPGDVMASVARAHSQIGAGLFVSAAGNLRDLFTEHPEIVPARYDAALLPALPRCEELVARITSELADPKSALGADGAIIKAYLGRQLDRPQWLGEGLEALAARTPEGDGAGQALLRLVREVWTAPISPTGPEK